MTGLLRSIRNLNQLNCLSLAEPFAGGAGASLSLLFQQETHEIHINDLDPWVRDSWHSAVHYSEAMVVRMILFSLVLLQENATAVLQGERRKLRLHP